MLDLRYYYIPHDYLIVTDHTGAKAHKIRTLAPLPQIVAAHHAEGYFPKSYHNAARAIEGELKSYDPTD